MLHCIMTRGCQRRAPCHGLVALHELAAERALHAGVRLLQDTHCLQHQSIWLDRPCMHQGTGVRSVSAWTCCRNGPAAGDRGEGALTLKTLAALILLTHVSQAVCRHGSIQTLCTLLMHMSQRLSLSSDGSASSSATLRRPPHTPIGAFAMLGLCEWPGRGLWRSHHPAQ